MNLNRDPCVETEYYCDDLIRRDVNKNQNSTAREWIEIIFKTDIKVFWNVQSYLNIITLLS